MMPFHLGYRRFIFFPWSPTRWDPRRDPWSDKNGYYEGSPDRLAKSLQQHDRIMSHLTQHVWQRLALWLRPRLSAL
jgi:hypothetical protein